jgi:hypothetical protein
MKNGQLLIFSGLIVLIFVISSHFGAQSYFQARQLTAQVEYMTARTRLMKQQVGESEQKIRLIQRVNDFVDHARDLQLTPEGWARYDVNVVDALTFKELARMIEQCVHNKDLYYLPLSFHLAVGQAKNSSEAMEQEMKAIPLPADATNQQAADLALSLKGAFYVRH